MMGTRDTLSKTRMAVRKNRVGGERSETKCLGKCVWRSRTWVRSYLDRGAANRRSAVPRHRLMSPEIRFFASPTLQRDHRASVLLPFYHFLSSLVPPFYKTHHLSRSPGFKHARFFSLRDIRHVFLVHVKAIIFLFLLLLTSISLTAPSGADPLHRVRYKLIRYGY